MAQGSGDQRAVGIADPEESSPNMIVYCKNGISKEELCLDRAGSVAVHLKAEISFLCCGGLCVAVMLKASQKPAGLPMVERFQLSFQTKTDKGEGPGSSLLKQLATENPVNSKETLSNIVLENEPSRLEDIEKMTGEELPPQSRVDLNDGNG